MQSQISDSETKFFYQLTPDRILSAVESLGFKCTGRCIQLNSMENRVYDVEIELDDPELPVNASQRSRIVKFYRPGRWSKAQIQEEHDFLFDLESNEISVVSPIRDATGQSVFELADIGIYFSLCPKVGGRSPDELDDQQCLQIGRLIARLHNIGATRQAEHRQKLLPEEFTLPSLDFLLSSNYLPSSVVARYRDVVEEIVERATPKFADLTRQRIHGDAHLGNLLWGREGPFWVDFDDMLVGPPVQDLWLIVPGRDDYAKAKLNLVLEGYEQFRSFDYSSLRIIEALRAMRIVHFNAWIAKRWEDPAFKRVFVDFGSEAYWREQVEVLEEQLGLL